MASKAARVNIRMEQETYDAYEKVASFFNRSVADFMREALDQAVPTMHALGAMIDQARAGDVEAMQRLYDAIIAMHQGTLDMYREAAAAAPSQVDDKQDSAAVRASNTYR